MKIGLRILQRIVREADPYKKYPNRSPRLQTEETIYIVGAIQESPENERYNQPLRLQTEETVKLSLP